MVINALSVIGLDSSRWYTLPDYPACSVATGLGGWYSARDGFNWTVPNVLTIEPVSETGYEIVFDSSEYSVYAPGQSDNGYEYLALVNMSPDALSRRFTVSGIESPLSGELIFYSENNLTEGIQSAFADGQYYVVGCNSLRLRTARYSGDKVRIVISVEEV